MKRPFLKLLAFTIALVLPSLYFIAKYHNPYAEVEWLEDWPGAGDRYKTFTPVLKVDNNTSVGPTVGADYGTLSFEDTDNDGVKEAIIESDGSFTFEEFSHEKHTLKCQHDSSGSVKFTLVKSEVLQ